jgi:hypothetical protein
VEVEVEEVRRNESHVTRYSGRERGREIAVDFHGDDVADTWGQGGSQCAAAGTDFEERIVWCRTDRIDDLPDPG